MDTVSCPPPWPSGSCPILGLLNAYQFRPCPTQGFKEKPMGASFKRIWLLKPRQPSWLTGLLWSSSCLWCL